MQQTFHTFRAASLDEAYLAMRRRLGDEAVVIRTTTVPESGLRGLFLGQKVVEVTASTTIADSAPQGVQRQPSPVEKKYLAASSGSKPTGSVAQAQVGAAPVGSDARVKDTVDFFRKLVSQTQQRIGVDIKEKPSASAPTGKPAEPIVRGNAVPAPVIPFEAPEPVQRPDASMNEIREDINDMRSMLDVLTTEVPGAGLPQEFVPHYQLLVKHGVTKERAAGLVRTASKRGDLRAFREPRVFLERLKMELRRHVSVTGGIALSAGTRKVVALVGSTGVGKTTNLAKLAALYTVQEHVRVGVITTDTYRVAATDQLDVYAKIIDIDMRIAHDVDEMKVAIDDFKNHDLVLIDTAGGSPFNREQMTELRTLLDVAAPDEVHLLTSASTGLEDLREAVTHFSILRPSALFFTKLDETKRYGQLYCLAAEAGLPVSYFSVGQNVPDDILPARPGAIAKLVLEGEDYRGSTS